MGRYGTTTIDVLHTTELTWNFYIVNEMVEVFTCFSARAGLLFQAVVNKLWNEWASRIHDNVAAKIIRYICLSRAQCLSILLSHYFMLFTIARG